MLRRAGFDVHGTSSAVSRTIDGLQVHQIDLLNDSTRELLEKIRPTHLLLTAWITRHGEFWTSPDNERWLEANTALAGDFFATGGQRVVMAGSCAEYDWSDPAIQKPVREVDAQGTPATLYGRAKKEAARRISALAKDAGGSFANGRIFFPVGLNEVPSRLLPFMIGRLLRGRDSGLRQPELIRDFIDVRDAGAALAALLVSGAEGAVNIGSGRGVRLDQLAERLAVMLDRKDILRYQPPRELGTEPPVLVADISRLKNEVGFTSQYSLEHTLASAIAVAVGATEA